ncbi:MAG: DUF4301 family protein [Sinomicrobium sp.]|nr:DUF4301 family protein [Sinomicrobium sp.]
MIFNEKDIQQITGKGIAPEQVLRQLQTFKKGIPYIAIVAAATPGNGIVKLSPEEEKKYVALFEAAKDRLSLLKFVPASGAASRMFKSLFEFLHDFIPENETFNAYVNRKKAADVRTFFIGLEKFPFYDAVMKSLLKKYPDYEDRTDDLRKFLFVNEMLTETGFNYGQYPKALLPFHKYKAHLATAFEEHLFEAALYGASNNTARLHFTVTEHYLHNFREEFDRIRDIARQKTGIHFTISFSYQKQHTDTIAVNPDNSPFRKSDGTLLFRPSGHGALIENLNEQLADVIFIKNVDNVVVYKYEQEMAFYKKALAGKLLELRDQSFYYVGLLDASTPSAAVTAAIEQFLTAGLNVIFPKDFEKYAEKHRIRYLKAKLNRPIRVCGMVKDEGEPGGGPFWVKDRTGTVSLQIVEAAQINIGNASQKKICEEATHFNPVDMMCSVKNYKGEKYNLPQFTDPDQGFITRKSREGRPVKVLELPGLWNGAMAHWTTVFVEVPLITFNPVKTVNDLLKSTHQVR